MSIKQRSVWIAVGAFLATVWIVAALMPLHERAWNRIDTGTPGRRSS